MRSSRVKGDRFTSPDSVCVEPERYYELAADHVTVFDAGVADQLLVDSGAAAHVIADKHEVDCGLPDCGQLLPCDPRVKNELPPLCRRDHGRARIDRAATDCQSSAVEASQIWQIGRAHV